MLNDTNWVRVLLASAAEGLRSHVPCRPGPIIPIGDRSTLFTTAGIQSWRSWVLGADPASDVGRIGVQWCVRMNSLDRVGASNFLTSFCMLSVLTRGTADRRIALERMLDVFVARWGLPFERLAFSAVGASAAVPEDSASLAALDALGVPRAHVATRPRAWAHPFKPDGPAGPELFILFDRTGTPCQPECGPLCSCGRFVHFWNLEFLENRLLLGGAIEPAALPFIDSAGSLEWVACAVTGAADTYHAPPLARLTTALRQELATAPHGCSEGQLRMLADHVRTIALLLASGVAPGARAHGHVLRRLVRRALAVLHSCGTAPVLLPRMVRLAGEQNQVHSGFPPPVASAETSLNGEAAQFITQLNRMRQRFDQRLAAAGALSAEEVFEMHATHGVPWEALDQWLAGAGVAVDRDRVVALRASQRQRSRARA